MRRAQPETLALYDVSVGTPYNAHLALFSGSTDQWSSHSRKHKPAHVFPPAVQSESETTDTL